MNIEHFYSKLIPLINVPTYRVIHTYIAYSARIL